MRPGGGIDTKEAETSGVRFAIVAGYLAFGHLLLVDGGQDRMVEVVRHPHDYAVRSTCGPFKEFGLECLGWLACADFADARRGEERKGS